MTNKGTTLAVLTGDIVNSTKLNVAQFDTLLHRLKEIQSWISQANAGNTHSIRRGDEFQTVIYDPANALHYALLYRVGTKALGKAFDCRISFAIARNEGTRELVDESMGEAFIRSGRGLKTLKSEFVYFDSDRSELVAQFSLLLKYLDWQLSALTSRQCEVLLPMLQHEDSLSVSELADTLNIAVATASKSLKSSGWPLIQALREQFYTQVAETLDV